MSKRKRPSTMLATQVAVFLSLNIQVRDDNDARLLTVPLLTVTALTLRLWDWGRAAYRLRVEAVYLMNDIRAALDFTGKVFSIGFNSLAFGLGVRV